MLSLSSVTVQRAALLAVCISGLLTSVVAIAADDQPADPVKDKRIHDYLEYIDSNSLERRRNLAESMATNAMESLPLYKTSLPLRMEYDPTSTSTPKKMTFKIGPPG